MSLSLLPLWFWALFLVTFIVLPLVWFFYRRWLSRLDLRLGLFLNDYLHWRFGADLPKDQAKRLSKRTAGLGFSTLNLQDNEQFKQTKASIGFGLARRSGTLVSGQGPIVHPMGAASHINPGNELPPVRPLLKEQLWPLGDRVLEPLEVEREKQDKQYTDLSASFAKLFDSQKVSGAVQFRNRLMWESYADGLSKATPQPFKAITPFVFATVFGMLSQQRRLAVEQAIPEEGWGDNSLTTISFAHLLKSVSGLTPTSEKEVKLALIGNEKNAGEGLRALIQKFKQSSAPNEVWDASATSALALSHLLSLGFGERIDVYKSFVRRTLFDRLGMINSAMAASPDGLIQSWSGLSSTPRDMLRFASLYQSGGFWQGERLLDEAWFDFLYEPVEVSGAVTASAQCFLNANAKAQQAVKPSSKLFFHGPPYPSLPQDTLFALRDRRSLLAIIPSEKVSVSLVSVGKPFDDAAIESFIHRAITIAQSDSHTDLRADVG